MKAVFIAFFSLLLGLGIVRVIYDLEPNRVSHILQVFLQLPPDMKGHFEVVLDSISSVEKSLAALQSLSHSGANVFQLLKAFFRTIGAFFEVPIALVEFIVLLLEDTFRALSSLFDLLFGPVVAPITPNV